MSNYSFSVGAETTTNLPAQNNTHLFYCSIELHLALLNVLELSSFCLHCEGQLSFIFSFYLSFQKNFKDKLQEATLPLHECSTFF